MAPPKIKLDLELIEKLASIHCTMIEIGHMCDVSVDTLERRCADVIKRGRDKGKVSLRRLQWSKAQDGNVTMMIWLGKQLLGQRDQNVVDVIDKTSSDRDDELENQIDQLKEMISSFEGRMVKK